MTDQNPFANPTPQPGPTAERTVGRLLPGIILVVLGIVFLLSNLSGFELRNWWALFILIPAVSSFASAYDHYQRAGTIDHRTRNAVFGGLLLTGLALIFLFDLGFSVLGPVGLILVGGWLLLEAFWK